MEAYIDKIIRLSSFWLYSVKGLSFSFKLSWVKFLISLFNEFHSREYILLLAIRRDIKSLDLDNEKNTVTDSLALLSIFLKKAQDEEDVTNSRLLKNSLDELKKNYLQNESTFEERIKHYDGGIEKKQLRTKIEVPTTVFPLFIEHIFRWCIMWFFLFRNQTEVIWLLNIFLVPVMTLSVQYFRQKRIHVKNREILNDYGGREKYDLVQKRSAYQWTLLVFMVLISLLVVSSLVEDKSFIWLGLLLSSFAYILYYPIYTRSFSAKRINEKHLIQQLKGKERVGKHLTPDENDEEIVNLASRLKSISGRLEAYVLESALFGALAFSGFLQIMAENLVSFDDLESFASHTFALFQGLIYLDFSYVNNALEELSSKSDLFALISVETLLCSVLFLAVIASRLQFSDVADKVSQSLELVKTFNMKEEMLLTKKNLNENEQKRMNLFNQRIYEELKISRELLIGMIPVSSYMRYFRNAGIFAFFAVLITSALFITPVLSWLFGVLGIGTLIYFNRKVFFMYLETVLYALRVLFVQRGYIIFILSVVLILTGFFLRTLAKVQETDLLIGMGFFFMGLYAFIWIYFVPHYDAKFEPHLKTKLENTNWWMPLRFFWGLALLLSITGFSFQFLNLKGGYEMSGIGLTTYSFIFLIFSNRLTTKRWLGFFIGFLLTIMIWGVIFKSGHLPGAAELMAFSFPLLAVLVLLLNIVMIKPIWHALLKSLGPVLFILGSGFKILHLPGAGEILTLSLLFIPVSIIFYYFQPGSKRIFHKLFILNAGLVILLGVLRLAPGRNTGEQAYENYTINPAINQRITKINDMNQYFGGEIKSDTDWREINQFLDEFEEELDWYNGFTRELPVTGNHLSIITECYNRAIYIYNNLGGTDAYQTALRFVKFANEPGEKLGYSGGWFDSTQRYGEGFQYQENHFTFQPLLESILLLELNRKDEAKTSIIEIEENMSKENQEWVKQVEELKMMTN